jgi:predicted kinase
MPDLIMMVGIPYSGKSHYAESMGLAISRTVISTDAIVHQMAEACGRAYNEVFSEVVGLAQDNAANAYIDTLARGDSVMLDQTNLTVASRARKLVLVPSEYRKVCIVVPQPTERELEQRKQQRTSHRVPDAVLAYMREIYQEPTVDEGFNVVYYAGFDDIVICLPHS